MVGIGMIMVITIINYLDRGTLNYMWVTNVEYQLVDEFTSGSKVNEAVYSSEANSYELKNKKGEIRVQLAEHVFTKAEGQVVVNREGIAYDLGIINSQMTPDDASKEAKDILGTITIFYDCLWFQSAFLG